MCLAVCVCVGGVWGCVCTRVVAYAHVCVCMCGCVYACLQCVCVFCHSSPVIGCVLLLSFKYRVHIF